MAKRVVKKKAIVKKTEAKKGTKPKPKPKNPKGGAPSKLTEVTINRICKYIAKGHNYTRSCILCNISRAVFAKWKKEAIKARESENGDEWLIYFIDRIEHAEEQYIASLVDSMNRTAKKSGKLALEILERKRPKEFGKVDSLKITGDFNITKFDIKYSPEEEAAFLERFSNFFNFDKKIKKDGEEYDS